MSKLDMTTDEEYFSELPGGDSDIYSPAERIVDLEKQRDELLAVLDQAANGQHLDDVPNHDDNSLRMIASRIADPWAKRALLAHADRIDAAIASVKGGAA